MLEAQGGPVVSYLEHLPMGLAAAITVQRACKDVTMPALEMEMLCCSMAS